MTDTSPVIRSQMSIVDMLGNYAKALPVLAVLVVCYSIEFEIVSILPYGPSLLIYYSWQDYARVAVVWFPFVVVVLATLITISISIAALFHLRSLSERARSELNALEKQLGETLTPRRELWRHIFTLSEPRWRSIAYLTNLVVMAAMMIWARQLMNVFTTTAWFFAMLVVLHGARNPIRINATQFVLPDLWGRDMLLAAVLLLAAIVGGFAGYLSDYDFKHAKIAKIMVKSEQGAASVADGCHVIRALSATLLASCKGNVVAINNSIIEMVEYPLVDTSREGSPNKPSMVK